MKTIDRDLLLEKSIHLLESNRSVALLGPRQCGKTTLARSIAKNSADPVAFFDLENPKDLARLADPMLALEPLNSHQRSEAGSSICCVSRFRKFSPVFRYHRNWAS